MTALESYFDKETVINQAKRVQRKKSHGIDGVSAKDAMKIAEADYSSINHEICNGTYKPSPILKISIPKDNGKTRIIGSATTRDRIVQGCINHYLGEMLDKDMSVDSFGFRQERNCQLAVMRVVEIIEAGYEWIISIDLKDCFTHLDKYLILWLLQDADIDKNIIRSISNVINNKYISQEGVDDVVGCPQGSNISPTLCNLVLNQLDQLLIERNHPFVRYADDIYVFCRSRETAKRTLLAVTKYLENKLKLEVNRDKTEIICSKSCTWGCLGFMIKQDADIHVLVNPRKEEKLRNSIKARLMNSSPDMIITDINSLICGFVSCNQISELGSCCKRMDAFIKRGLNRYERVYKVKLDRTRLKSCHDCYREVLQQRKAKENEPATVGDGKRNNETDNPCTLIEDTAVSFLVRAPPCNGSISK